MEPGDLPLRSTRVAADVIRAPCGAQGGHGFWTQTSSSLSDFAGAPRPAHDPRLLLGTSP